LELADEEPDATDLRDKVDLTAGELAPEFEPFYDAFEVLRHDRQFGAMGGMSRISFAAIDQWARRYGIEGEEFELFRILIGVLDDEFVTWCAEQKTQNGQSSTAA
tara:strand:+ start:17218 stop:17532 length:315 start_codon:yes stop_codon:yes gene_type:complete